MRCEDDKLHEVDSIKIEKALELASDYGNTYGAHHKMWLIDQMVRALTGDNYTEWVKDHNSGELGDSIYKWETGIAP